MTDGMEPIAELLRRARAYSLSHPRLEDGRPASGVAIVACMDSRLRVESLFSLRAGEAHVLRNAGGTVTDDVIRGLIVSQRLLGTRHVVLVHHTDCGMGSLDEAGLRSELRRDTGLVPEFPLLAFSDAADDVRESMERLRSCPFLPARDSIHGFVFDVARGTLEPVAERLAG